MIIQPVEKIGIERHPDTIFTRTSSHKEMKRWTAKSVIR